MNATHLRRLNLQWDREGIIDLLARRIASNSAIKEVFRIGANELKSNPGRLKICRCVLPRHIYDGELVEWIHLFTTDASQALNPRNVLTLVRLARHDQLAVYDRDDPLLGSVPSLISNNAIIRGFEGLSKARLEDTVYAEFNSLRPIVEALLGKPARFTREELSSYIKTGEETEKFKTSLETLEYAGIVSVSGQGVITVARLYRPALDISMGRNSALSVAEERSLEDRVDVAIETLPQSGRSVRLPDMSAPERKFVHNYVEERYPDYRTVSSSGGRRHEFKALFIHKRSPNAGRKNNDAANNAAGGKNNDAGGKNNVRNRKLQGYDPAHVEVLQTLRADAAEVDGYFAGPPLKRSLASTLIEIDRLSRRNKARRRIVGFLADSLYVDELESSDVRPILGSCHAWIIDAAYKRSHLSEELRESITEMIRGLCAIAADEGRPAIVMFSCPAVKDFAISIADQCPAINFVDRDKAVIDSRPTVILLPQ